MRKNSIIVSIVIFSAAVCGANTQIDELKLLAKCKKELSSDLEPKLVSKKAQGHYSVSFLSQEGQLVQCTTEGGKIAQLGYGIFSINAKRLKDYHKDIKRKLIQVEFGKDKRIYYSETSNGVESFKLSSPGAEKGPTLVAKCVGQNPTQEIVKKMRSDFIKTMAEKFGDKLSAKGEAYPLSCRTYRDEAIGVHTGYERKSGKPVREIKR